ncbi:hypothetical protein KSP39_PZI014228 [Platanthera zijinensis]|uniref:CCHC-type domain-containing protein n=1 Tax=Platanthera zijinensis TaxID=2320716 RepID=A0AAP0BDN6_9ASPA
MSDPFTLTELLHKKRIKLYPRITSDQGNRVLLAGGGRGLPEPSLEEDCRAILGGNEMPLRRSARLMDGHGGTAGLEEETPQVEQQRTMQQDSQARTIGPEVVVPSAPSVTVVPAQVEPVGGTPTPSVPSQFQQSELGQTLSAILDAFKAQQAPVQQQAPGSNLLSTFRALSPPAYLGTESPVRTEEWLDTVQELMAVIRCPNSMAVTLVVTLLELHAKRWWKSLMGSTFQGRLYTDISWNEFTEAFLDHFIPSSARDELEERFLQLKQGSKSVTEYQREFQHLARFADSYDLDDRGYARRFYKGLRDLLRQALLFIADASLAEIIDMAKRLEADHMACGKRPAEGVIEVGPSNRRRNDHGRGRGNHRGGRWVNRNYRVEYPIPPPPALPPPPQQQHYQQPGGRREVICFECNQPGHVRRVCLRLIGGAPIALPPVAPRGRGHMRGRGRGPPGRNQGHAREHVFALDMTQERNPQEVITGTCKIY